MRGKWTVLLLALALSALVVTGCTAASAAATQATPAPSAAPAQAPTVAPTQAAPTAAPTAMPAPSAQPTAEGEVVDGWVGTILAQQPGDQLGPHFQRDDGQRYGIGASDPALAKQVADLRGSSTRIKVWGRLFTGAPASQARHIEVERLEVVQ